MKKYIKSKLEMFYDEFLKYKTENISEKDLEGLPNLMQIYLEKVNLIGNNSIKLMKVHQEGSFKLKTDSNWKSYRAKQYINTKSMSFLWYAKIRMVPFINIHVIDEYIKGKGALKAKLLNLITVANERGEKLDQGEFLRFLSEAPWYPSFYLNKNIIWNELDDKSIKVSLKENDIKISGNIFFNSKGLIKEFTAKRYYSRNDEMTLEDWHGYFDNYKQFNGILIPISFKVCWHLKKGDFCYIKGKIVEVDFN